jgi:hypothetical protein
MICGRGQWHQDMQHGFGVQRWKNGAVYIGQWKDNKEHGKGTYYFPASEFNKNFAKQQNYSLYIGDFVMGNPTQGVQLEGEDILQLTQDDITLATKDEEALTRSAPSGSCRAFRVIFDGKSAFWQLPAPFEKIGEFEVKVKICQFETRILEKTYFRGGKIEDTWYRPLLEPSKTITVSENESKTQDIDCNEFGEAKEIAEEASRTATDAPRHVLKEKLYKAMRFRGTCVRNKAGIFPCPTKGTLFDEDQEFEVEYDGNSFLLDWPTPIRIFGEYKCSLLHDLSRESLSSQGVCSDFM